MTIPTTVMHAGQNMYLFDGFIPGEQGPLAKFTCVYCGGGDYIITPYHSPNLARMIQLDRPLTI